MSSSWRIPRRTVLRGLGASLALPCLDIMRAAQGAESTAAPPVRLACLIQPNGVFPPAWEISGEGRDFRLSNILEPLEKHKQDLVVISNLDNVGVRGHGAVVFVDTIEVDVGFPVDVLIDEVDGAVAEGELASVGMVAEDAAGTDAVVVETGIRRVAGEGAIDVALAHAERVCVAKDGIAAGVAPIAAPAISENHGGSTGDLIARDGRGIPVRPLAKGKRIGKPVGDFR